MISGEEGVWTEGPNPALAATPLLHMKQRNMMDREWELHSCHKEGILEQLLQDQTNKT